MQTPNKESIASGIDSAAHTLREKAESLPGGAKVASAAQATSDAMETAADYVRDQDFEGMIDDAQELVKRHPGAVLLAAAALGFVIGRSFFRD
jgi:ElaB/YqjD/DUF883 family membrane-anchored ribosome-binding protein